MKEIEGNMIIQSRSFIFLLWISMFFISCQKENESGPGLVFWSSTNTEEIAFTKKYIDKWNQQHPDLPVTFQPVPEGQSSEEVILAAVVGRTTPDLYANMWQGDVEDFARSGVLIPFDTLDGFMEWLYARCDSQVVQEITSSDGHIYQVPWKVNPIMMMYNPAMLKPGRLDSIPSKYDDLLKWGSALKDAGYWLGISEVNAIWWQRFFNFLPLYYAASGGMPLVQNGKAIFNNEYGIEVFAFLQQLYNNGYFPREQLKGQRDPFLAERLAITFTGPWTIEHNNKFKPAGMEFYFAEVPIPEDHTGPVYTYGDPKNMVMFNTCKNPEGAWKFLQSILTPEADKDFVEMSHQVPRRKDLDTNPIFIEFFNSHQDLWPFAKQAKYVSGIYSSRYMKEVLDLISQEYESCVVFGLKTPEEAIRDAAHAVELLYLQ